MNPISLSNSIRSTLLLFLLVACGGGNAGQNGMQFQVLATTTIVADIVRQVGGDFVGITILMPVGTDPHEYSPRPQDVASISEADLVFINGAGLEESLQPLLEAGGATDKLVDVSHGLALLSLPGEEGKDPHTWMDPKNVLQWVKNITTALVALDPEHAPEYELNAISYAATLSDLDTWIRSEIELIPRENRLIVSDHAVLGYFIAEYGFVQLGTITGSFSTEAAPSARDLAVLEDEIRYWGVQAIFISETSSLTMADQVAGDTAIKVVWLYHASLTDPSGPAGSYLEFMRYNVSEIVEALK